MPDALESRGGPAAREEEGDSVDLTDLFKTDETGDKTWAKQFAAVKLNTEK